MLDAQHENKLVQGFTSISPHCAFSLSEFIKCNSRNERDYILVGVMLHEIT